MPIPDFERARVEEAKVRDYLLNQSHPDGGSKAVWFYSLGYTREAWPALAADLRAVALNCEKFTVETTRFGVKYKASGTIGGSRTADFRPGIVMTVWIVEGNEPPRLITAYPDRSA